MKNLISICDLDKAKALEILSLAGELEQKDANCTGKSLINVFFENSTRTITSFERAAQRLKMDVTNINMANSSLKKGESELATIRNIIAMSPDIIALRHSGSGMLKLISETFAKEPVSFINGGDGTNEHPTQALADCFTLQKKFGKEMKGLNLAICGDIMHSRVARSNIFLLSKFGVNITLVGLPGLIPDYYERLYGCKILHSLDVQILKNFDAIMMLRSQFERHGNGNGAVPRVPFSINCDMINEVNSLRKNDLYIMHPGPINEGLEMDTKTAFNYSGSLIEEQVRSGVLVRMAVIKILLPSGK